MFFCTVNRIFFFFLLPLLIFPFRFFFSFSSFSFLLFSLVFISAQIPFILLLFPLCPLLSFLSFLLLYIFSFSFYCVSSSTSFRKHNHHDSFQFNRVLPPPLLTSCSSYFTNKLLDHSQSRNSIQRQQSRGGN